MPMRYQLLACDYDGTLAHHGEVSRETIAALERLRASGRQLVMVTGRELDELLGIFPPIDLFEWVVAENGGLLFHPVRKTVKKLGPPPPQAFSARLKEQGVSLSVGRVVVATWAAHHDAVVKTIEELALDLRVVLNKDAVMVLPAGVDKASGLRAALAELNLPARAVVAVGDAENDLAMLEMCGCGVAVANALPDLKNYADLVTRGERGDGVCELIDELLASDLSAYQGKP